MSERTARIVAVLGLAIVLGGALFGVRNHERTLAEGRVVLLELAPVDPRSIMQGDYMALRFAAGERLPTGAPPTGLMVLKLGEGNVGVFNRLYQEGERLAADEALLEYRLRGTGMRRARIVTDAWFFQEGTGHTYQPARYGELRVRPDGQALLVALRGPSPARAALGEGRYAK